MTTPTNWPNPERPGVPMFPERDGWHMTRHSGATKPTLSFWLASEGEWKGGGCNYSPEYMAHPMRKYIGPVLTPTQITEMLAGERERCARLCEEAYETTGRDFEYLGCLSCADDIRNLGDAP